MDTMLNWLWQGGVVALAAFAMLLALKRARANVRYVVCWAALFIVVALPALTSLAATAVPSDALSTQRDALVSLPDTWWTSTLLLLAVWIVWATVHAGRFVLAVAAIRRARAGSRGFPLTAESHLPHWLRLRAAARRATLVTSEAVSSAAVLGWGRPMIAVSPSLLNTLEADELDRVLIHEWAHVQRRDDLIHILQLAVRAIAGWHPAVWWIERRLHLEREIACDEMAVAITGSPKTYAGCLMKLASLKRTRPTLRAAPAALTSSGFRARIVTIVSARPSIAPLWSRSIATAIVVALCLMSVRLGGLRMVEAAVLALPVVSSATLSATFHQIAPIAVPAASSSIGPDRPLRTVSRADVEQRSQLEQSLEPEQRPLPHPIAEPAPSVASETDHATDSAGPEADPQSADPPAVAAVPQAPPERAAAAAPGDPGAPWSVAADGGIAIGRKSKDAGVATAGFFSRFARRVAGAF